MINNNQKSLVLVVGAGASKELNLPVGTELIREIASALDIRYKHGSEMISGDATIDNAFRILARTSQVQSPDINSYLSACWKIRDAMPQAMSIDNYIDQHRSDNLIAQCGKLAIASRILESESKSKLKIDRSNIYNKLDFANLNNTWLRTFFQLLIENCQPADLPERFSKVGIICFNYDRCIEHFLHCSLQNYYAINSEEATIILKSLEIHHPYEMVGKLPWQDSRSGFDYGFIPNSQELITIANELKTFTESINLIESDILAIRSTVLSADRVAFLGFSFHPLNIQLLFPKSEQKISSGIRSVYGTAYGISSADIMGITQELSNQSGCEPQFIHLIKDLKCSELFYEFHRSLSLL